MTGFVPKEGYWNVPKEYLEDELFMAQLPKFSELVKAYPYHYYGRDKRDMEGKPRKLKEGEKSIYEEVNEKFAPFQKTLDFAAKRYKAAKEAARKEQEAKDAAIAALKLQEEQRKAAEAAEELARPTKKPRHD